MKQQNDYSPKYLAEQFRQINALRAAIAKAEELLTSQRATKNVASPYQKLRRTGVKRQEAEGR